MISPCGHPDRALKAQSPSRRRNRAASPSSHGLGFRLRLTRVLDAHDSDVVTMEKIVALCKRRGFIFQSSEIYGGLASTYDYGHYGVLLKTNVKAEWWRAMVQERDDMVALDAAILMHPRTWEASGHLEGFTDPLVQCLGECKRRWREDHLREAQPEGELQLPGVRRRAVRAAQLQPDVRDPHGPRAGRGLAASTCAPRPPRASS